MATYWVAKYIEDPFRNEPRNVGIIVSAEDGLSARFAGERDDGTVDGRWLRGFKYADVYKQWIDYWREQVASENIDEILSATTSNYFVVPGGEVSDTGSDSAAAVCKFLFGLIVSDSPVMQAFDLATEADTERDLSLDLDMAFRDLDILSDYSTLAVRHPIKRKQPIRGVHATHEPSFSQLNGKLYLFEAIDFNSHKPKLLKERAGFMAYMFADIRLANKSDVAVESYSIVRPKIGDDGEAIDYAREVLSGESQLIDWANKISRDQFLKERQTVAESLGYTAALLAGGGNTGPAAPPVLPSS